jgi:hypothetical protein
MTGIISAVTGKFSGPPVMTGITSTFISRPEYVCMCVCVYVCMYLNVFGIVQHNCEYDLLINLKQRVKQ